VSLRDGSDPGVDGALALLRLAPRGSCNRAVDVRRILRLMRD